MGFISEAVQYNAYMFCVCSCVTTHTHVIIRAKSQSFLLPVSSYW